MHTFGYIKYRNIRVIIKYLIKEKKGRKKNNIQENKMKQFTIIIRNGIRQTKIRISQGHTN